MGHICKKPAIMIKGVILALFFLGYALADDTTITTYYPYPAGDFQNLTVDNGVLKITGTLNNGNPIETTMSIGGTWGWLTIENPRGLQLMDTGGGLAKLRVKDIRFEDITGGGNARGVSYCKDYNNKNTADCDPGYFTIACGAGDCSDTNMRVIKNPDTCNNSGWIICLRNEQ